MSAPPRAAACSSGAIRAWARSVQCEPSPRAQRPPAGDLLRPRPATGPWTAPGSTSVHDWSGDHRKRQQTGRSAHRFGRIEQVGSRRFGDRALDGGVEHVRFGRCRHHGTVARHHVGNDQRRRLARARRTEDHDRLLGSNEAPTAFAVSQIDTVPGSRPMRRDTSRKSAERPCEGVVEKKSCIGESLAICSSGPIREMADVVSANCSDCVTVSNNPCKQTVFCPCSGRCDRMRGDVRGVRDRSTARSTRDVTARSVARARWCLTWR